MKYGIMRNGTFNRKSRLAFFYIKKNVINLLTKLSTSDIIYTTAGENKSIKSSKCWKIISP